MNINLDREKTNLIIGVMIVAVVLLVGYLIAVIVIDSTNQKQERANIEKALELTDNQKVEINDQILNDYTTQFLIAEQFGIDASIKDSSNINVYAVPKVTNCSDGIISENVKLNTTAVTIISDEEIQSSDENVYELDVDEVQNKAIELFGEQIELTKVGNKVQNGKISIEIDTDINFIPYKIKEVRYNKELKQYIAVFDYVKYTEENYPANKIEYDDEDIIATYTFRVKNNSENDDYENYIFVSLGC